MSVSPCCQVIGHLYEQLGPEFIRELDGMFAFVIEDRNTGTIMAGRDHMGGAPHTPLYRQYNQ
jgi:asparagine synthase (glutamine-hydrolysing)